MGQGRLFTLVAVGLAVLCAAGCLPRLTIPNDLVRGLDDGLTGADNEYDTIAAALKEAAPYLGRDAGRRILAWAARGVLVASGVLALLSLFAVVGATIFKVGVRAGLIGLAIALGGVFVGYFITVYGVLVSEVISWALIAGLFIVAPLVGFIQLRAWWARRNAVGVLTKRAADGDDGRDGIALLPVGRKVKRELHRAWDQLRSATASLPEQLGAIEVLEKYRLPVPIRGGGGK